MSRPSQNPLDIQLAAAVETNHFDYDALIDMEHIARRNNLHNTVEAIEQWKAEDKAQSREEFNTEMAH